MAMNFLFVRWFLRGLFMQMSPTTRSTQASYYRTTLTMTHFGANSPTS